MDGDDIDRAICAVDDLALAVTELAEAMPGDTEVSSSAGKISRTADAIAAAQAAQARRLDGGTAAAVADPAVRAAAERTCAALDDLADPRRFYKWRYGDRSPRRARRERLKAGIRRLFEAHKGKRGSPMITADPREAGWRVSKNTVAALMAEMGLAARPKRRRKGTTRPGKGRWKAPDLVKRDFPAEQIDVKWYGDGTGIDTDEGKLYLDSVLDAGSRRVLGFALGEHYDADLAYGALVMAVAVRGGQVPGVIFPHRPGHRGHRVHRGPPSGPPAGGWPSPSRWAGPGRRWTTRSSSPGTPPWSPGCGGSSTSRPGRPPGPGARPGLRTATTTAGIPRWAGSPRWITSGRWREGTPRVSASRPLRGPDREGGGFAAAHLKEWAAALWPGGRAARVRGRPSGHKAAPHPLRGRPAAGPAPGDLCGPWRQDPRARHKACPAQRTAPRTRKPPVA